MNIDITKPFNVFYVFVFAVTLMGCKKFIDVGPPTTSLTEVNVFDNDLTATAAVTGIYSNMSNRGLTTIDLLTFSKLGGLSADEFDLWSGAEPKERAYYKNELQSIPGGSSAGISAGGELWNVCYTYVYSCNQAIAGLSGSSRLNPLVKQQLLGEVKFLRAFMYTYLVNLYGDVPLVTGTDPEVNRLVQRSPVGKVYELVVSDLKEAQTLLSASYLNSALAPYTSNIERTRPTKWAATALLARTFLYIGDNAAAEAEATSVINQSSLFDVATVGLNSVFLKNSKEAIWQLQPVTNGWNTIDARWFDLAASPMGFTLTKSVYLSSFLYNSFEPGDNRKVNWVGSYATVSPAATYYFPSKYKAGSNSAITATNAAAITEYHMMLRMGEQYLIRAEARARQGNISGSISDLNVLRTRARAIPTTGVPNPLPNLSVSLSQSQVIDAVMHERKVELFSEWGHRWIDLKRTNNVNAVMSIATPLKGGAWQPTDRFYPVFSEELSRNPNLTQTPGY